MNGTEDYVIWMDGDAGECVALLRHCYGGSSMPLLQPEAEVMSAHPAAPSTALDAPDRHRWPRRRRPPCRALSGLLANASCCSTCM